MIAISLLRALIKIWWYLNCERTCIRWAFLWITEWKRRYHVRVFCRENLLWWPKNSEWQMCVPNVQCHPVGFGCLTLIWQWCRLKGIMQMVVNKCIIKWINWTETAKLFQSHKEMRGLKMLLKISAFQREGDAEAWKGLPSTILRELLTFLYKWQFYHWVHKARILPWELRLEKSVFWWTISKQLGAFSMVFSCSTYGKLKWKTCSVSGNWCKENHFQPFLASSK